MQIIPNFQYLHELIKAIVNGEKPPKTEFNLTGPRWSGKSVSVELMSSKIICLNEKIKWIVIRQDVNEAHETFMEYVELFNELFNNELSRYALVNSTRRTITFKNGNYLRFIGIQKNRQTTAAKSDLGVGLKNLRCKYAIIHFEEAHQIGMDDKRAILEAVRGYKHLIQISTSNPWAITNEFISYCHNALPYDATILTKPTADEQFKVIGDKVFHYSRLENNPYLTIQQLKMADDIKRIDPRRARITVYGLPGIASGGIYTDYIKYIKDAKTLKFKPNYFKGGIDWGITKSSSTAQLWGIGHTNQWIACYDVWEHNNETSNKQLTSADMARNIVSWYKEQLVKFPQMAQQGLVVKVDYSAFGVIDLLNIQAQLQECSWWLHFQPCLKHPISTRIDIFTATMSLGMFYMDKEKTQPLLKEFELSVYDDEHRKNGMPVRLDKYDHHINAMEYALAEEMYELVKGYDMMLSKGI